MYMRRMVMALAVLVVVTEAAAGVRENNSGQRLDAIGEEMTGVAMRIASGEVTPLAAPTAAKAEETTSPTKPAPKVEPANEEKREETAAPQEQLDLDTLEKRLRQTDALGFFTKWALKNQVDDLLDRFRRAGREGQERFIYRDHPRRKTLWRSRQFYARGRS